MDDLSALVAWFRAQVFYILVFSLLTILLIFAGVTVMSRNRASRPSAAEAHHPNTAQRRQRKAQRTQSKQARRKRH